MIPENLKTLVGVLKPYAEGTYSYRPRVYRYFWHSAFQYLLNGTLPSFYRGAADKYELKNIFDRFRKDVENYKTSSLVSPNMPPPAAPPVIPQVKVEEVTVVPSVPDTIKKTPVIPPVPDNDISKPIIDALSYESVLFTDIERCLLQSMIKQSRKDRFPNQYSKPFYYGSDLYDRICGEGNYGVFSNLCDKLENLGVLTREKKTKKSNPSVWYWMYTFNERPLLKTILDNCPEKQRVYCKTP